MIGLYIHIPFCARKCGYCDFYSITKKKNYDEYTSAVISYIENVPFSDKSVDTIYFGGGTPNLLGADNLGKIVNKAKSTFNVTADAEISLEANPESIDFDTLIKLREYGFNRISFGVQSSNNRELSFLGRGHSAEQAKDAILMAEKSGFKHISGDLILAIPHQTKESLEASINFLTSLPLDHISAYILKIEPDTPFDKREMHKLCVSDDESADYYLITTELIGKAGFEQYEISNFAKEGGKSLHNLKYWNDEPYLGIGPSAHSYIDGKRFAFESDIDEFIKSAGNWDTAKVNGSGGDFFEYAMLKLRLRPGLNLTEAKKLYPEVDIDSILKKAEQLSDDGILEIDDNTISLTPQGFLISNYITANLLF